MLNQQMQIVVKGGFPKRLVRILEKGFLKRFVVEFVEGLTKMIGERI